MLDMASQKRIFISFIKNYVQYIPPPIYIYLLYIYIPLYIWTVHPSPYIYIDITNYESSFSSSVLKYLLA